GRATVVMLDMNDDHHEGMGVRIRQRNVADGYHPPPEDPVLSALIQASFDFLTLRVRRGLPPAARPRHSSLSRVLQALPYRRTRDGDQGGEVHKTIFSNYFRGGGWAPTLSLNEAARETRRAPRREVSLDRHSDQ